MNVDNLVGEDAGAGDGPVVDHLERALEANEGVEKNFHVRQAMQLLVTEDD